MNEFSCKSADMNEENEKKNSFNAILIDWFMCHFGLERESEWADRIERGIERERERASVRVCAIERWQSLLAFLHAHSCVC